MAGRIESYFSIPEIKSQVLFQISQTRQTQLDLGVRGVGVGAESPLPPLQVMDGGVPLSSQPLHYAESSPEIDTQEEFKALPGKLGPAAAPMPMVGNGSCYCLF